MQIGDFTQTEADYLEAVCNYSPEETELFRLRLDHKTLDECAEIMTRFVDGQYLRLCQLWLQAAFCLFTLC